MCGRFALTSPVDEIAALFPSVERYNLAPRYNVAPRQPVAVLQGCGAGSVSLRMAEWGLVPPWRKEIPAKPLINARIETVTEKASFRSAIKRRRCLVPANAWYEWQGRGKNPHAIVLRSEHEVVADHPLFFFAAISELWHGPDGGDDYETVAILTADAAAELAPIHHRRPLCVPPSHLHTWLVPHDPLPRGFLETFPFTSEAGFDFFPVSRHIGQVRYNAPDCLVEVKPEAPRQGSLF